MAYYDRYRGSRRKRQNRIKIILLILVLLVVVGLAALFFLQDTVIFTTNGFRFPFFDKENEQKNDPPLDPDDVHLEIEDPQPGASDLHRPETPTAPTAPSAPQEQPTQPVELPRTAALVLDGSAILTDRADVLRRISEGAYSQLALQVKSPEGISLVDDGLVKDGVSPDASDFLTALEGMDVPKVAVISALRDNVRPRTDYRASALKLSSGSTWLDREYLSWFDPAGKDTLSCLLASVEACEAAGFEQVVLQNFRYPTAGKLELIDYGDAQSRRGALTELARRLRESTEMPLGLVLTQEAATGLLDGTAGLDVAELAQYFDVLYAPASDFSADLSALDSAVEGTACRVGLAVVGAAPQPADFDRDFIRIP
ncbi:MAG: hypothetical protein IJA84_00650 [Clostridia bacterium]|nr:hypothetical protein [Clostridia bacterium]